MKFSFLLVFALVLLVSCSAPKTTCIDLSHLRYKAERRHFHPNKHLLGENSRRSFLDRNDSDSVAFVNQDVFSFDSSDVLASREQNVSVLAEAIKQTEVHSAARRIESIRRIVVTDVAEDQIAPTDTVISKFDRNYIEARKLAILSFASGLGSILALALPILIVPLALLAVISANTSLKKYRKSFNKDYKGLAIAGLILGGLVLAFLLILILAVIFILVTFGGYVD